MKVNVWQIIIDHLGTLRNDVSKKISTVDILIFFVVPVILGIFCYLEYVKASKGFFSVSVTFFGVFVALLLNFQVAAFGIYNRKWSLIQDEKLSETQTEQLKIRTRLLKEANANISYLILISIFSILVFLFLYAAGKTGRIAAAISCMIYIHFILNLLMVLKRSHVLFRMEYEKT